MKIDAENESQEGRWIAEVRGSYPLIRASGATADEAVRAAQQRFFRVRDESLDADLHGVSAPSEAG